MIFYVAFNEKGFRQVCKTQAEAKAINREFVQMDIPVDKDGLRDAVQELLTLADAAVLNGSQEAADELQAPQIAVQPVVETSPAKQTLMTREQIEEQWPNQPLAWRLDLAQQVMDECRKAIPWPPKDS